MKLGNHPNVSPGAVRQPVLDFGDDKVCPPFSLYDSGVTVIFWTLDFNLDTGPDGSIDNTTIIDGIVTIEGTSDFGTHRNIEVDMGRGGWYRLPCILGHVYVTYPRVEGSKQPIIEFNVSVGRGAMGLPAPTRTITLDGNAPLTSVLIPRLAYAAVLVSPTPVAPGTVLLNQHVGAGGVIVSSEFIGTLERDALGIDAAATSFTVVGAPAGSKVRFLLR